MATVPTPAPDVGTLVELLREATERAGDRVAVLEDGNPMTFDQLAGMSRRLAGYLHDLGVRRGEPVALLMENSQQFIVAHYALLALGCVVVPVNGQLRRGLLADALDLSEATRLVMTPALLDAARSMPERPERLETFVVLAGGPQPAAPIEASVHSGPGLVDATAPVAIGELPDSAPAVDVGADDYAILFTTSGTTGKPKGIRVTHRQALLGLEAWANRWSYGPDTASMMVAPFSHVVYNPLVLGAHRKLGSAVVVANLQARAATRAAAENGVTALMGTPSFFIQLLHDRTLKERDLSSIDTLIYGAAPMPVPVIQALAQQFPAAKLFNCYGLTETCSAVSCLGSEHLAGHESSVGLAHQGVEITIRDTAGQEVPVGELGEVCCRGANIITSYYKSDEANATRFHGGWLKTGDVGYLDEDSFLYLLGRADDLINVAGEKLYPRDIENVLYQHPDVFDAAVVGVPDPAKGQVVKAFVVARGTGELDLRAIKRHCIRHLSASLAPKHFEVVDQLPRNPSGKVMRRELVSTPTDAAG